ncbi:MAG TPA: heme exporter protein CcmD [Usitatibacter sp.]|nr:heme exporter protein CcmD [Usitatibacter sp.]
MTHEFYLWMSYGVFALAIAAEIAGLALRKRQALKAVEEERELEAQD